MESQKLLVLGVPVDLQDDYGGLAKRRVSDRQGAHIVTLNAEMAIQAQQDPKLAQLITNAELVIPDGAGIVLYGRARGKEIQRCPGIELAEELIQAAIEHQWRVFLIGGAPDVIEAVLQNWQAKFAGDGKELPIAGYHHGYFDAEQEQLICAQIKQTQPDLILVGLGVPRQEFWIQSQRRLCPNATWIGVGGSFDIWSGRKERAPAWLRNNHLEWVYRLYKEPWRWRRMLALPYFVWSAVVYSLQQMLKRSP
ncbi:N-acetylmannosaminyltransferase [Thalassoporum mexicanum PCC 7367]|uniref:WecB/TagA/CpsF family glycosyltransferase n=1 Tax=Thalassoporum mexicanum TaxID=3457544 RepID=UPI00029FA033|nr:WecB/TagA/CpsF family glycosyltransferase [Pseudanabaena sp. PCC 7367]AFY70126.1 N-acetylmannosaminyltransferase [Pseudanabaena sp. PCC 7367]